MAPLRTCNAHPGWSRRGFTLVELLVALTLLAIAVASFVPLFVYVSEGSQANRARLVAAKLAASVIEEIRARPYGEVGLTGGNPAGDIPHRTTQTIDGIVYTVTTDIWWVDDPADDRGGSDPIPYDYKRVRVTVTAPGLFTGAVTSTARINTLSSLEGEEEAFPGGNIRVQAQRGWQTTPGDPVPVEGLRADLTAGPDAPQTLWTDESGRALFAILDAGDYTVAADAGDLGLMVRPDQADQPAVVTEGVTTTVTVEAETACHLSLELRNRNTGALISAGGTLVLQSPFGDVSREFTSDAGGVLPPEFLGDIWPVGTGYPGGQYGLQVLVDGYLPYDLADDPDTPWDGTFTAPGESRTVVLYLTPATASVTVTAAGAGTPVAGATVEIYRHTYTYQGGAWTDECSAAPVAVAQTARDGRAAFALADNSPAAPPDTPQDGDTYSRYCVRVTADGYQPFGPEHGAFWVTGGQQMTDSGPVSAYAVTLQPDFRSIRVRAERNNGVPRDNVRIRVTGPGGYQVVKLTGADGIAGEALFEGLQPGTYTVERWVATWWLFGRWDDPRQVDVVHGEYLVLYRY